VNMGKESIAPPWVVWSGDCFLAALAIMIALPRLRRH
jgi:hypothetical protein